MIGFNYKYILNEKDEIVPEPDILKWGTWFEEANRTVAKDKINNKTVSTIFLGIDHSFSGTGEPVLWETAIIDENDDADIFSRCSGTRKDALEMHQKGMLELREKKHS